jgi:endonuclease/exonuclease/phosphatase (EEP) superfamily protein YafD
VVQSVHIPHACITVILLLVVQHSSQKFPLLVESACLSLRVHFICLTTLGLSIYPLPQSLCHPTSISFSVQNLKHQLSVWPNSPTAVYCKSSNNAGDEIMMSIYSSCPMFYYPCSKSSYSCMTSCH